MGVVGAGVIGRGVAQDLAQTGHSVTLLDISDEILQSARAEISRNVRFHHLVATTEDRYDQATILARIEFTTDPATLATADFVIENATEDWEIKARIYRELGRRCRQNIVLAANTSAIPISRIAIVADRPEKVVGMHFMNPVPLKPAVEVIRGEATSDETVDITRKLLRQMNKRAIVVRDSPGFVSNRVLMLTVNEAIHLVDEGVADPADIDDIFKHCFGHSMGPLETADLIGLDTILRSLAVLHDALGGSKFKASRLLHEMVDAGNLGRKTGQGFHDYGLANTT